MVKTTTETNVRNVGFDIKAPEKTCTDPKCPFHGALKIRGRLFSGVVISDKMQKTATIEWPRKRFVKKFERFELRRSRVKAHNPTCIDAKKGDIVNIMESRPLAKTKNFVIVEIVKKNTE